MHKSYLTKKVTIFSTVRIKLIQLLNSSFKPKMVEFVGISVHLTESR